MTSMNVPDRKDQHQGLTFHQRAQHMALPDDAGLIVKAVREYITANRGIKRFPEWPMLKMAALPGLNSPPYDSISMTRH